MPKLFLSTPRLTVAFQFNSKAFLFHSECRLAIQQHVLSTLCRFRAHVSPLFSAMAFLFFSFPPHFCSIRGLCRNHAHLSVLCHRISVLFYASSQPFGSSAQLRFPYFSFARHSISIPSLIYCSHHLSTTYLFISFASLLPTLQVFAVTLHTLRIPCRAMRCQRNSLHSTPKHFAAIPLPCHPNPFRSIP